MKRNSILAAVAATAFSCAFASDMREPPVPVDTAGLLPNLSAKIEKHAAEGLTSLSRYLARTRKYHNLVVEDVVKEPEVATAMAFSEKEYKRHAAEWRQAAKN